MKIDLVIAPFAIRWLWGIWWSKTIARLYVCPLPGIGIVFIFKPKPAKGAPEPKPVDTH